MNEFAIEAAASESGPYTEIVSGDLMDARNRECFDIYTEAFIPKQVATVRYLRFRINSVNGYGASLQYLALVGEKKEHCMGNDCPHLLELGDIQARVIQQNQYTDHHPEWFVADNVFTNACDTNDHNQEGQNNYYHGPIGFTGLAFTVDLGSLFYIHEIMLRNSRNGVYNSS